MREALETQQVGRGLETLPALAGVLPGGGVRAGASYAVEGSTALVMALLAGPSAAGAWSGVVGMPAFGAEAAAGFGVDLDRLVLVPEPGREWLGLVATLVDALTVVVADPPSAVSAAEASRLEARIRRRGAVLITVGRSWPRCEARLRVSENSWDGLGSGHGHLAARRVTVTVTGRGTAGRPRRTRLWLPDPAGRVRSAEPVRQYDEDWRHEVAS